MCVVFIGDVLCVCVWCASLNFHYFCNYIILHYYSNIQFETELFILILWNDCATFS